MPRHEEALRALRAAATASSTSSGPAAWTEVISVSSLGDGTGQLPSRRGRTAAIDLRWVYAGDHFSGLCLDPFVVDEETGWLCVFTAIGSCELDCEVGHVGAGSRR